MEKTEISSVLKFMNAIYTKKIEITKETLEAWSFMLDEPGITKEMVKQAIKRHSMMSKYPPDLPEIQEQLKNCFNVQVERLPGLNTIIVNYPLSAKENAHVFPFIFTDPQEANQFISYLKKLPDYTSTEEYFKKHIHRIEEKGNANV